MRHSLEALFHGKCAYCESRYDLNAPVDIEHFRPKGGVEGTNHPGYWWLAAEWTNLLPSCIDCNRRRYQQTPEPFASLSSGLDTGRPLGFVAVKTGKETSFPISANGIRITAEPALGTLEAAIAAEQSLLLDPCRDDPNQHLTYLIDRREPLGIVYPAGSSQIVLPPLAGPADATSRIENAARLAGASVRGAVSIQVYGLNRLALVQERTRLLRKLEFLGELVIEMSSAADELEGIAVAARHESARIKAIGRLRASVNRALAEIRSLGAPNAPFSEMVKAWIAVFRADMAVARRAASRPPVLAAAT